MIFWSILGWDSDSSLERTQTPCQVFAELHQVSYQCRVQMIVFNLHLVVTLLGLKDSTKFCSYHFFNLHSRHRPSEVELLFQLLRVFTIRHVPDFHFLRTFLDEKVAKVSLI